MPDPPFDHYTSWMSGGARVGVGRNCTNGQTPAECTAEFDAAVAALKTLFPED